MSLNVRIGCVRVRLGCVARLVADAVIGTVFLVLAMVSELLLTFPELCVGWFWRLVTGRVFNAGFFRQ